MSEPQAALSPDSDRSPVSQSVAPTPPGLVAELDTVVEERGVSEEIRVRNEQLASAEETLYAERERYRELFEATPAAYLLTDTVGVVREANRRAVELLGVEHRLLVGKPLVAFVTAEQRRPLRRQLSHLIASDQLQEWTLCLQPRHRPPVAVLATVGVARDHTNQVRELRWLLRYQLDAAGRPSADPRVLVELLTGQSLSPVDGSVNAVPNLTSSLREVVKLIVGHLGADGGALTLGEEDDALGWVTATSQPAYLLARVEQDFGEGPGVEACAAGRPVATPDVRVEQRWPRSGPVVASHDVRAVLAAPVRVEGRPVGVLTVVAASSRLWSEGEAHAINAYAAMLGRLLVIAADAVKQRRLAGQLRTALDTRIVIEQAKGVLMERKMLPPSQAFQVLRRMARSSSRKLVDVAADIIANPGA
jgi:PAS domain-containing protein